VSRRSQGVPGIGVPQCAHVLRGRDDRILDRILGAIVIAEDEVSDTGEARRRYPHQLCEGIRIATLGPFDQVSLHRCHRYGANPYRASKP
jgi:hypothetical protein